MPDVSHRTDMSPSLQTSLHATARRWWLAGACAAALCPAIATRATGATNEFDWGPLASRLSDPAGATHIKALGPIFERGADMHDINFWAIRPFYSTATENEDHSASEFLWPVAFAWDFHSDHTRRILTSYYADYNVNDPHSRWHWWCFPFWFQGRDSKGETYHAFFPLGGTIHEFLFQDEVDFALWPIYGHSRLMDEDSYNVLWPIFCRENNAKNDRLRVWPIYGWNIRRDDLDQRFALWPVFTWARYYRPGGSGYGYLVLPLWGHIKRENQEAWMLLPPFFKYATSDQHSKGYAPWPFIQWDSGDIDKVWAWPIWGYKNVDHVHSGFYLWPLGWWRHMIRAGDQVHRYIVAPIWYSETTWQAKKTPENASLPATNCVARYWQVWPLCDYERSGDQARFRMLKLWPLRHTAPIEREYAPIWTLYQHVVAGDNTDDEFLWGLVRHQRRGNVSSHGSIFPLVEWNRDRRGTGAHDWNLLKGLLGYEDDGTNSAVRLLWFGRIEL